MKRILRYHIPILFAVLFFVCIIGNLNDTVPEMQDISVNTETEYCFKSNFAYNINAYLSSTYKCNFLGADNKQ